MGTPTARATHLGLSILGAALYVLFVIPRWWVLTGDFPATLGTVGRIAAGVPIAAAAVPVMLYLQRSLTAVPKPPEAALRLRAWSAVLHVIAGILIVVTAVAEIWLSLEVAGPWLFAVYGAAGAIAVLAVLAFVLSFTAEKPPAPPKPAKVKKEKAKKEKRSRKRGKATGQTEGETEAPTEAESGGEEPSDDTEARSSEARPSEARPNETGPSAAEAPPVSESEVSETAEAPPSEEPATDSASSPGGLLNQRPTGKKRHRLRR